MLSGVPVALGCDNRRILSSLEEETMITLRSKALLVLTAVCGMGIGVLAQFTDGMYSAMLLFLFPFVIATTAVAVGIDLSKEPAARIQEPVCQARPVRLGENASGDFPASQLSTECSKTDQNLSYGHEARA